MNIAEKFTKQEIELLNNVGINIENRDYEKLELKQFENQIVDYIMSASSKNGEIDNRRNKYDSIFRKIDL